MADAKMLEDDRRAATCIRTLAETYRDKAALFAALGRAVEESNCRALADLHEERASRLERRVAAALAKAGPDLLAEFERRLAAGRSATKAEPIEDGQVSWTERRS
jgi:hypothetical protein